MKSIWIAFAMYSRLPVPHAEWTEKNMRYAVCWFPVIGLILGIFQYLAYCLCEWIGAGVIFRSALMTGLPVFLTGGIHVDGFLDTADARSSYGDREKKLKILKDPHTGAFAVIACVVYFILMFGAMSELTKAGVLFLTAIYILERALSGLSVVTFPLANPDGSLAVFANGSHKTPVRAVMLALLVLCIAGMIVVRPVTGLVTGGTAILVFFYYRRMACLEFGGINGDMAGYFLQLAELWMLAALVVTEKILTLWS